MKLHRSRSNGERRQWTARAPTVSFGMGFDKTKAPMKKINNLDDAGLRCVHHYTIWFKMQRNQHIDIKTNSKYCIFWKLKMIYKSKFQYVINCTYYFIQNKFIITENKDQGYSTLRNSWCSGMVMYALMHLYNGKRIDLSCGTSSCGQHYLFQFVETFLKLFTMAVCYLTQILTT